MSGHTGSSVADVNSVSLAMPVPYTRPRFTRCAFADPRITAEHISLVCNTVAHAYLHALYIPRDLCRLLAQLRSNAVCDDRLLVVTMGSEHVATASRNHTVCSGGANA